MRGTLPRAPVTSNGGGRAAVGPVGAFGGPGGISAALDTHMLKTNVNVSERHIARCRIILSIAAFVTVFIDPTRPTLTRWLPMTGGPFTLDRYPLAVLLAHLAYSVAVYVAAARGLAPAERIASLSTGADVVFGAAIALVTEGANSPFYVFFAFAVVAVGMRSGLRASLAVTGASVVLYLSLIVVSRPEGLQFYVMRPAYLAITGYLVGYLGEQRVALESRVRRLEAARQREHIARSLHDGYVQALSAVNLRLETCRERLRLGEADRVLADLTELQTGVNREHDQVRAYIRSLVDLESTPPASTRDDDTRYSLEGRLDGSLDLVEHALQIILEGIRNVGRHARARSARVAVRSSGPLVTITIDDDGVGFPPGSTPPWSIASRAAELGGSARLRADAGPGGHVEITLAEG
jgi:signal transduction histidine kinase